MEVTGSAGKGATAKKQTVNYEFGADMTAAAKMFGDKVVYNAYMAKVVIDLQNLVRNGINAGKKPDEIKALVVAWKPGVKVSRKKSTYDKILASVTAGDFTDEQIAMLAKRAGEILAAKKK